MVSGSYQISTEAYEGPIDLFYDLVVADRIDASGLRLSRLVEGFLSDLWGGAPVELEHLSEFLLVLALLCRLKARRMLGEQQDVSGREPVDNPDRQLWYQLAHLTFGEAVEALAERLDERSVLRSREAGPDWSAIPSAPRPAFRIDPGRLASLAGEVMSRVEAVPDLDHLALDLPTVEEAIGEVWRIIGRMREASFQNLSERCADRVEEAAWFMGLLELVRQGKVLITQTSPQVDIHIRAGAPSPMMVAAGGGP